MPSPTSPEAVVELDDVHFSYGNRPILNGVSLAVLRGEVVGIMGGSGSGKTTLLRLIGGQIKPDKGAVRVLGQTVHQLDVAALYKLRRKMGVLFQQGGLFSDVSTFENVAFQMREHTDLPEELIYDLVMMKLNAVGLRGAAELMPNELSGGMARRVALARAIALDPPLIIYDEPFAGLDPISLGVIAKLIRELNDALGLTSIVVTYDLAESLKIVDHVYFLSDGVIVGHGTPEQMRNSDQPHVKQFIHSEADGPVTFHLPAPDYTTDLELAP